MAASAVLTKVAAECRSPESTRRACEELVLALSSGDWRAYELPIQLAGTPSLELRQVLIGALFGYVAAEYQADLTAISIYTQQVSIPPEIFTLE